MKRRYMYISALQIFTTVAALRNKLLLIAAGRPSCCSRCGSPDVSPHCAFAFADGILRSTSTRGRRAGGRASVCVGGEHSHCSAYSRGQTRTSKRRYSHICRLFDGSPSLAEHESINLGEFTEADRQQLLQRVLVNAHLLRDGDSALDYEKGDGVHPIQLDGVYASETLGRGFCNWVFKVTPKPSSLIVGDDDNDKSAVVVVKVFSDLARVRVPHNILGSIDVLASDCCIGPQVMHRGTDGIVMEYIDGTVLTKEDVHGIAIAKDGGISDNAKFGDGRLLCEKIGVKLAQLHGTPIPSNSPIANEVDNMLWRTLDAMLDFVGEDGPIPEAVLEAGWTHDLLCREVQTMKQTLDALDLPQVLCHGDFKPSNIVVVNDDSSGCSSGVGEIVLIDYELSGPGYRGFDFYKLFRTADPSRQNDDNMAAFVRSYLESSQLADDDASSTIESARVAQVLAEMKLFEPLTWLEAGIFFLFAAKGDPTQIERWEKLALDRFTNFDASKCRFEANLEKYTKAS